MKYDLLRGAAGAALALSLTFGIAAAFAQPATAPAAAAARLELPAPTGRHVIGTTELHLIDEARADPWVAGKKRELMVSVWYPAASVQGRARAPYMQSAPGKHLAEALLRPIGVDPARVDLAAIATHAYVDAPADARRGPYPVILYSPGGNLPRTMGTVLVEDLASRGYVVVTIDHTYGAGPVEFPGGRLEAAVLPRADDLLQRKTATRVADTRFVLDELERLRRGGKSADGKPLAADLRRAMDLSRVGMFGHSAGGFTALETAHQDKRLDAVANLDGSLAYSMSKGAYGAVVEQGLNRPLMLIGAGVSGSEGRPHTHQWAPEWKRLWERSTGWKRDFYIAGGEHLAFADHVALMPQLARQLGLPAPVVTAALGTADPGRVLNAQRDLVAAFFDQHLKRKAQSLDAASASHPDVERVS